MILDYSDGKRDLFLERGREKSRWETSGSRLLPLLNHYTLKGDKIDAFEGEVSNCIVRVATTSVNCLLLMILLMIIQLSC